MTPTTKPASALNSRFFLYAAGFFAGMSLMAVEIGANRLLAPYFSSSQIVWTIVIGTIMIAMALGNVWGVCGRFASAASFTFGETSPFQEKPIKISFVSYKR